MTSAVGRTGEAGRWPKPVLVPPRGLREALWVAALAISGAGALALPGAWYFTTTAVIVAATLKPRPRALLFSGAAVATAWTCAALATTGAQGAAQRGWRVLSHSLPAQPDLSAVADVAAFGLTSGLIAVATFTAYDTRWVRRPPPVRLRMSLVPVGAG